MTELLPTDLPRRVRALLDDTGALHTAAGLGFGGAAKQISGQAAQALRSDEWHIVDTRKATADNARAALTSALQQQKPLVLLVDDNPPPPALRLARAFADRRHGGASQVDLGDRTAHAIGAAQSLVVVVDGVSEHAALPADLQRIDFWEFLPWT